MGRASRPCATGPQAGGLRDGEGETQVCVRQGVGLGMRVVRDGQRQRAARDINAVPPHTAVPPNALVCQVCPLLCYTNVAEGPLLAVRDYS